MTCSVCDSAVVESMTEVKDLRIRRFGKMRCYDHLGPSPIHDDRLLGPLYAYKAEWL